MPSIHIFLTIDINSTNKAYPLLRMFTSETQDHLFEASKRKRHVQLQPASYAECSSCLTCVAYDAEKPITNRQAMRRREQLKQVYKRF